MLDETIAGFSGAFTANKGRDIRTAGQARIIEAGLTGLAETGRGGEAGALLERDDIGGALDDATRARLKRDTAKLSEAHDLDRAEQERRDAADVSHARETAALAFATGFRPRMATGEATQAEIAAAKTGGTLTTAQAERLRAEMADEQSRREKTAERAGRVASVLQAGGRLDPEDFDDHDDVAHHYAATLMPALTDLDPAQKAFAISGYVVETRISRRPAGDDLGRAVKTDKRGQRP